MYNLQKEFDSVLEDVLAAGLRPHVITKLTASTRTTRRLGQCKKRNGRYSIDVSAFMLADGVDKQALHNVIAHEILHAVDGCFNHGSEWKRAAMVLSRKFPEYTITRTTSIAATGAVVPKREYKYILRCETCGALIKRKQMCRVVAHPEYFRCGRCRGRIVRVMDDEEVWSVHTRKIAG